VNDTMPITETVYCRPNFCEVHNKDRLSFSYLDHFTEFFFRADYEVSIKMDASNEQRVNINL